VKIDHSALIIGGGVAGMNAALSIAKGGFGVHLVEREDELGGNLRHVYSTVEGEDPQLYLRELIRKVNAESKIHVHLACEVSHTDGFMGKFTTSLKDKMGRERQITHGVTILATGGQEYHGDDYYYTSSPHVVSGLELEAMLAKASGRKDKLEGRAAEAWDTLGQRLPKDLAMILCVGPAQRYCSRICCTTALKQALQLKRLNPDARVTVLYKDIRTYGFKERLYTEAREAGVLFLRYDDDNRPDVQLRDGGLEIQLQDPSLGTPIILRPELLMLSMPIIPAEGSNDLASKLKCSIDGDGFFLEAHIKLRPVDFSSDGYFMAGMAHYPKLLDETIVQAEAAASRAARILSQSTLTAGGVVAQVDPEKCVGCLTCVRVCPFGVPKVKAEFDGVGGIKGAAFIEPTVCHGCGNCAAECPAKAITVTHYKDGQITIKLDALLTEGWNRS
jgi:heterodisulfide reductase subunit A-like polyferredoxin